MGASWRAHPVLMRLLLAALPSPAATLSLRQNPFLEYCHNGSLAVRISTNNMRDLATNGGAAVHASVRCGGVVPDSCGNLQGSVGCADVQCPCQITQESLQWPILHALAAQVVPRCAQGRPLRVLNIGLGIGAVASDLKLKCPDAVVDNVEYDPKVAWIAQRFFGFEASASNTVERADALAAVQRREALQRSFDVALVDCFDEKGVAPSCRDERFVGGLAKLTAGGGRVAHHVWGGELVPLYQKHFAQVKLETHGGENLLLAWN